MIRLTLEAWLAVGVNLFGADRMAWKYRCPACGHVQSAADFAAAGVAEEMLHLVYQDCIGRHRTERSPLDPGRRPYDRATSLVGAVAQDFARGESLTGTGAACARSALDAEYDYADLERRVVESLAQKACDWTLAGTLKLHRLEVLNPETLKFEPVFEYAHPRAQGLVDYAKIEGA